MKDIKFRISIVLAVTILFIFLAYPPKEKIKLGLDLKGGMHLVLEVQVEDAVRAETDRTILELEEYLKKEKIPYETIKREDVDKILIEGVSLSAEAEDKLRSYIKENLPDWESPDIVGDKIRLSLKPLVRKRIEDQAVEQAKETIRNRVDEFGVAEPVIQREGDKRIIVQLPGVVDPRRVKKLIKNTAVLEFKLVVDGPFETKEKLLSKYNGKIPEGTEIVSGDASRGEKGYFLLKKVAAVTGSELKDAGVGKDSYGAPAVSFRLNRAGAKKFEKVTREHRGEKLAIVLDNKVMSAPVIEDVIYDSGIIRGRFTLEEANDLAIILRAGSLPASVKYLEERTVGPSLGADSIRKGFRAALLGLILVMIFMVFYYRLSGINAVIALLLNIIIIMGALGYLEATLTLPGIAGIILTIGMSVDANVLIFERIREDLRLGKTVRAAVDEGFKKAFITIFDANITTIIAAVFLFQFGTGPIRGFAITLIIGILASMFTAVYVSRTIFELYFKYKKRVNQLSI